MDTVGLLLHFLTRLAHHICVFFRGSERLQAVISALTSGKFYQLLPDKENPGYCKEKISCQSLQFVEKSRAFLVGDHFLYSHDLKCVILG